MGRLAPPQSVAACEQAITAFQMYYVVALSRWDLAAAEDAVTWQNHYLDLRAGWRELEDLEALRTAAWWSYGVVSS